MLHRDRFGAFEVEALFRDPVPSKESIVIERARPAEWKGVDRAGLRCAATTKSLIICRRLSEGLRDVERKNSNPSAAGLRFPRLTCPIEILISTGGGGGEARVQGAAQMQRGERN